MTKNINKKFTSGNNMSEKQGLKKFSDKCLDHNFNWANFFNGENAKIIEKLLDKKLTTPEEIYNFLFPITKNFKSGSSKFPSQTIKKIEDITNFFNKKFSEWRDRLQSILKNGGMILNPFDEIIPNSKDLTSKIMINFSGKNKIDLNLRLLDELSKPLVNNSTIYSDKALAMLILDGLLPQELSALPRFSDQEIFIHIKPDYYEAYWQEYLKTGNNENIIKSANNYHSKPITINYNELIKHLDKHEILQSEFEAACRDNIIGVYIHASENDISIMSVNNFANQSLNSLRLYNCGNPYYLKRYEELERLFIKKNDSHIYGEETHICFNEIWHNNEVDLIFKTKTSDFLTIFNYVQSTDMETKLILMI